MEILNYAKLADKVDTRQYRLLLYPHDNPAHRNTFNLIQRHKYYRDNCIYCFHVLYDAEGREILSGHGKKHVHVLLDLPDAKLYRVVVEQLQCEPQFLWPMKYKLKTEHFETKFVRCKDTLQKGFLYLLHLDQFDKTQYSLNSLHGSHRLVSDAEHYISVWQSKQVSEQAALKAIYRFLRGLDEPISFSGLFAEFVDTPYYKGLRSSLCERMRIEHNSKFYVSDVHKQNDERNASQIVRSVAGAPVGGSSALVLQKVDIDTEFVDEFEPPF